MAPVTIFEWAFLFDLHSLMSTSQLAVVCMGRTSPCSVCLALRHQDAAPLSELHSTFSSCQSVLIVLLQLLVLVQLNLTMCFLQGLLLHQPLQLLCLDKLLLSLPPLPHLGLRSHLGLDQVVMWLHHHNPQVPPAQPHACIAGLGIRWFTGVHVNIYCIARIQLQHQLLLGFACHH